MPQAVVALAAAWATVTTAVAAFGTALAFGSGIMAGLTAWSQVAMVAALGAALMMKPPGLGSTGQQVNIQMAGPNAAIPLIVGRTGTQGIITYRGTYGSKNDVLVAEHVLSVGPVQEVESFSVMSRTLGYSGNPKTGLATVTSVSGVDMRTSKLFRESGLKVAHKVGTHTDTSTLNSITGDSVPNVTSTDTMQGLARTVLRCKLDEKRLNFPNGYPDDPISVVKGVLCYDPRLDSTQTAIGGSGSHRVDVPSTHEWSENPYIVALNFALGWWTPSETKLFGLGIELDMIDVAGFAAAANVADANDWVVGGQVLSTDGDWAIITNILAAGGGVPIDRAGKLSCFVHAPKVAAFTLEEADVLGARKVTTSTPMAARANRIVPSCRQANQKWEMIAGEAVSDPSWLEQDNGQVRTEEIAFPLVNSFAQAHQLAAYYACDTREFLEFEVNAKPRALAVDVGDCIEVNLPEFEEGQTWIVMARKWDPATKSVSLSLKAETFAKHAFCLGQSQEAPEPPTLTTFDPSNPDGPAADDWEVVATSISQVIEGASATVIPAIVIGGEVRDPNVATVVIETREPITEADVFPDGTDGLDEEDIQIAMDDFGWTQVAEVGRTATEVTVSPLRPVTTFDVSVRYQMLSGALSARLILDPVTTAMDQAGGVRPGGVEWDPTNPDSPIANVPNALITDVDGNLNANTVAHAGQTLASIIDSFDADFTGINADIAQVETDLANAILESNSVLIGALEGAQELIDEATAFRDQAQANAAAALTGATNAISNATLAATRATYALNNAIASATSAGYAATNATSAQTSAGYAGANATISQTQAGYAGANAALAFSNATLSATYNGYALANATAANTSRGYAVSNATISQTQAGYATANAATAQTQSGLATTYSGYAATNATTAQTQAGYATSNAAIALSNSTLAATYAGSARVATASLLPSDFELDGAYWSHDALTQVPAAISGWTFATVSGIGRVAQRSSMGDIGHRGTIRLQAGRRLRFTARVRFTTNNTLSAGNRVAIIPTGFSSSFAYLSSGYAAITNKVAADGWFDITTEILSDTMIAYGGGTGVYARAVVRSSAGATDGGPTDATIQVAWFRAEDVTEAYNAAANATLAASNAIIATTQAGYATSNVALASTSAALSATYTGQAVAVANSLTPERTDAAGRYFVKSSTGAALVAADVATLSGYGPVRAMTAGTTSHANAGFLPAIAGKIYEVTIEAQLEVAGTGSPTIRTLMYGYDSNQAYLGASPYSSTTPLSVVGTVVTITHRYGSTAPTGGSAWISGAVWLRAGVLAQGDATSTIYVRRVTVRDITAVVEAAANATIATTQAGYATSNVALATAQAVLSATWAGAAGANASSAATQAGYALSNAVIASAQAGYATANASLAQSNATLSATYSGYALANATAADLQRGYAAANALIASTQSGYASANAASASTQAGLSATYSGYALSNATAADTQRGYATTNASVASTQAGYATANAATALTQSGLSATYSGYALANAAASNTSRGYAVTNATTAQTQAGYATANAAIASSNAVLTVTYATEALSRTSELLPSRFTQRDFWSLSYAGPSASLASLASSYVVSNSTFGTACRFVNDANVQVYQRGLVATDSSRVIEVEVRAVASVLGAAAANVRCYLRAFTPDGTYDHALGGTPATFTVANTVAVATMRVAETAATGILSWGNAATAASVRFAGYTIGSDSTIDILSVTVRDVTALVAAETQASRATSNAAIATTQAGYASANAAFASTNSTLSATRAGYAQTNATASQISAGYASANAAFAASNATLSATYSGYAAANATAADTARGYSVTNATISQTQAGYATSNAATATTQAGIATTWGGYAATNAATASTQAGYATSNASIATTQAGYSTANAAFAQSNATLSATFSGYAAANATIASTQTGYATANAAFAATNATLAATLAGYAVSNASISTTQAGYAIANVGAAASRLTTVEANTVNTTANVSTLQTAVAGLDAANAIARWEVAAAASGGLPTRIRLTSSTFGSNIAIVASEIHFGDNTVFDDATDTLRTTVGSNIRVIAFGSAFGTDGQLTEWEGPSTVAFSSMSRSNAYFYRANVSPYVGGSAIAGGRTIGAKSFAGLVGGSSVTTTINDVAASSYIEFGATMDGGSLDADAPQYGTLTFEESTDGSSWAMIGTAAVVIGSDGLDLGGGVYQAQGGGGSASKVGSKSGNVQYRVSYTKDSGSNYVGGATISAMVKITPPVS